LAGGFAARALLTKTQAEKRSASAATVKFFFVLIVTISLIPWKSEVAAMRKKSTPF
jgi:hypothetical protein